MFNNALRAVVIVLCASLAGSSGDGQRFRPCGRLLQRQPCRLTLCGGVAAVVRQRIKPKPDGVRGA